MKFRYAFYYSLLLIVAALASSPASADQAPRNGELLQLTLRGDSLKDNRLGFSVDREVNIYLPPGYRESSDRRYPLLLILHGITDPLTVWTVPWSGHEVDYGTIQGLMDRGIDAGLLREMILVLFDARTPFFGAHYVDSPVKGNWQDFMTRDLLPYMDSNYRTLQRRESRGVMGHSMGGYGSLRLAMDRPDLFGAVYALSPSLLGWSGDVSAANPAFSVVATVDDPGPHIETDFYVGAVIGVSQAFSPNPDKPPYFADYPFKMVDGELLPNQPAHRRWEENFIASRIDAYLAQPDRLNGIRFDAGFDDQFSHIPPTSRALSLALDDKGVAHGFELYNGDHRNRLWGENGRLYTEVLPYFSRLLEGQ